MYAAIEWLACRKTIKNNTDENENGKQEIKMENKTETFIPSKKLSFSIITEKECEDGVEMEEGHLSASTNGTSVNPYIIRTPTYSV